MPPNRKPEPLLKRHLTLGLSKSFPSATLSRALGRVKMDLNSSCFAEIRMDKGAMDDDELRPLSWLHSTDLLKDMNLDDEDDGHAKENNANGDSMMNKFSNLSAVDRDSPVDPKRHINSKPPFSFSCLIFMAIEDSPLKRLPVKDIYQWIQDHFPYFHNAPTGWKNSVRHNLSLNKCFRKVDKIKGQISLVSHPWIQNELPCVGSSLSHQHLKTRFINPNLFFSVIFSRLFYLHIKIFPVLSCFFFFFKFFFRLGEIY